MQVSTRKINTKTVLERHGLPTPRWAIVNESSTAASTWDLLFPVIVKPDDGYHSIGVVRVDDLAALQAVCRGQDRPMIAEEWARAREFTVAVIGNGPQRRGFPVARVLSERDLFLTSVAKERGEATTSPVVDAALRKRLEDLAVAAANALQLADLGRVDILEDAEGHLFAIDVNTLPVLHFASPYAACLHHGYGAGYGDAILAVIAVAALRHGMTSPPAMQTAHAQMLAAT